MEKLTEQPTTDLNTGVIRLSNVDEFITHSTEIIPTAIRSINIISHDLALSWLGQEAVIDALKQFILTNRRARIRLLVGETRSALSANHPLIPLIKKLSRIEARIIEEEILEKEPLKYEYILVDRSGLVVKQKPDQFIGFAHPDDKTTVKNLQSSFDQYWRYSQPSPELRYFSI
ncbi:hypothetical protein [Reinekea sp.]|jgi:hypothetical protein|uniref:DUF7931 domain-containing protein n=1 Tax=Reinekea sp. TaxID=1970455 RepID=UPI0039894B8E